MKPIPNILTHRSADVASCPESLGKKADWFVERFADQNRNGRSLLTRRIRFAGVEPGQQGGELLQGSGQSLQPLLAHPLRQGALHLRQSPATRGETLQTRLGRQDDPGPAVPWVGATLGVAAFLEG